MTETCDHRFAYGGMRYALGAHPRPGSGAYNVYHGHAYYCERCLEARIERSENGNRSSYQQPIEGALPSSDRERELLVLQHDRQWGW